MPSFWFVTSNEHDNSENRKCVWTYKYFAAVFYIVTKVRIVLLIFSRPHILHFSDALCLHSVSLLQVGAYARENTCAAAGFTGGFLLGLASS